MMTTKKMKRKKRKRTGISLRACLLFVIAGIPLGLAQQTSVQQSSDSNTPRLITTRSIEGKVLTASGAAVSGAVVLLKDGKTLQVRSYIAQKGGEYHFFGLSTDVNYTLR